MQKNARFKSINLFKKGKKSYGSERIARKI